MYTVAGSVKYPFIAISPSDPTKAGLGFETRDRADQHAARMNVLLGTFDVDSTWSKDFWKQNPEPWVVIEVNGEVAQSVRAPDGILGAAKPVSMSVVRVHPSPRTQV